MTQRVHTQTSRFIDVIALTKPRITLMTLIVAAGGMALAPQSVVWSRALLSLFGVGLLVSGSSAFNMYLEREHDRLMERTKNRPLPAGRLSPRWALVLGWTSSCLAVPALILGANPLTVLLGLFSLIAYVMVYTPMKRLTSLAMVVGAIPGAMPALLGYTAATGSLDFVGLTVFGVAFFWQLPHVLAISIFRGEEYTRAGFPVIPRVLGVFYSKLLIVATTILVVLNSFLIWYLSVGGPIYGVTSVLLGAAFIFVAAAGFWQKNDVKWSREVFIASLLYQTVLFVVLAVDIAIYRFLWNS